MISCIFASFQGGNLAGIDELTASSVSTDADRGLLEVVCANASVALFIMDERQHCAYMNPAAERLTGFTLGELRGKALHDFIHHTRPDGRPYPLAECPIDRALPQNNQEQGEETFVHKSGRFYDVAFTASPIRSPAGKPIGTVIEVRDITDEKKSKRKLAESEWVLEQLFTDSPSFMAILRVPGYVYERCNEKYYELVQRRDLIGKSVEDALPKVAAQSFLALLDGVLQTRQPYVGTESRYIVQCPDGTEKVRFVDFVFQPLRDSAGNIYAIGVQGHDVTEKVLARKSVELSKLAVENERANFRRLFKQTPEMVCILGGPEHRFEFVNEAHIRVLGFDATGKTVREAQPESIEVHGILDDVYRTGRTAELNEIAITVGDRRRIFNLTYAPRKDERGTIDGIMILGVEVTEQVQTREKLRDSQSRLKFALGAAAMGTWTLDLDANRIEASEETQRIFGVLGKSDVTEAMGKTLYVEDAVRAAHDLERAVEKGVPYESEYRIVAPDGRIRWILSRGSAQAGSNKILAGIVTDITERKEQELRLEASEKQLRESYETLRTLSELGSVVSAELDLDKVVQSVTDAATKLSGAAFGALFYNVVGSGGESYTLYTISGVPREEFSKFPMPRNTKVFAPTFAGEGIVRSDDITKDHRYGKNAPHKGMPEGHLPVRSYLAVPVVSRSGEVIGGLFFGHPQPARFSERHETLIQGIANQAAIAIDNARLYKRMQDAVTARDEFLSIASHELKTPLTSLTLQAQLHERAIKRGDPRAYGKERVDAIVKQTEKQVTRLTRLVDDMLDVSRIRAGKLRIQPETFTLGEVVTETVERLRGQFEKAGYAAPSLEIREACVGTWDRMRIEQVVSNLLTNAIRYGNKKPIAVNVGCSDSVARLEVRDQGIGIAPEAQGKIFDRFERAINANEVSGLGLGLFISRQIVSAHGGKISVESELGKGSVFIVELPLASAIQESVSGEPENAKL